MAKEYLLSSVHVHTKLCDGKNTLEELALSAWKAGLKTLGFSGTATPRTTLSIA